MIKEQDKETDEAIQKVVPQVKTDEEQWNTISMTIKEDWKRSQQEIKNELNKETEGNSNSTSGAKPFSGLT